MNSNKYFISTEMCLYLHVNQPIIQLLLRARQGFTDSAAPVSLLFFPITVISTYVGDYCCLLEICERKE